MREDDYGIYDSLTPETVQAIDSAMIGFLSSRPRKIRAVVVYMLKEPAAEIPALHGWFYMDRIDELIEDGVLVVVDEGTDWWSQLVTPATGLSQGQLSSGP
jgi:hypothetical protein